MHQDVSAFFKKINLHDEEVQEIVVISSKHVQIKLETYVLSFAGVTDFNPVPTPCYWLYESLISRDSEGLTLVTETSTGKLTIQFTKMHCIARKELLVICPPMDCTVDDYLVRRQQKEIRGFW